MFRENANDLIFFVAVARETSFTKAAAQLGVCQSALSHTIKALETRLGLRLLTRTTRSVSLTQAGEKLYRSLSPRFEDIESDLRAVTELRDTPAGMLRITATDYSFNTVLWPVVSRFMADYPDIHVEINCDYQMVDIVTERFDAGVRYGEKVSEGMIATRIAPDARIAVVASPAYFAQRSPPSVPRDLVDHNCINLRFPTHGGLDVWEFAKNSDIQRIRVGGRLVLNGVYQILDAAIGGLGIAYLPEQLVERHIAVGSLVRVLDDWCRPFPGFHIYYPSRRQPSTAFTLLIDALRYKH
ncbi:LysR family transcriptional regulator [Pseudomonas putida]|uniref:LysR family transcriptional regulator n=1 Tax=Pseudomonas putida TaxID=303 RepID=UPI00117B1F16|nr:LysR family transcriptional regulator [Pseudomonas putida]TRO38250.1 LysR family transcriptional regulator [Pseudomonas putida]